MDDHSLTTLVALATAVFAWGFHEIQQEDRRKRKTVPAILAMLSSVAFFVWMIFIRPQKPGALGLASVQHLVLGIVVLAAAAFWFFAPPKFRNRNRALFYLISGLALIAFAFGLLAIGAYGAIIRHLGS